MGGQIFQVCMILSGVIFGAIIGIVITLLWNRWHSRRFRTRHDIPNIIGKWKCQWFDDSQSLDNPKVEDIVEIQKWITNSEFVARGFQPQFHLSYPIVGEIDPSRVVIFVYKAARYPYEPNRGVVCMQLSRDGMTMEGRWFGRRYSGQLGGGIVKCFRVSESLISA